VPALSILAALTASQAAQAQAIDIGVIKNSDMSVVQKLLYPKQGKTELGGHFGLMPFDPFTITPKIEGSYGMHMSELLSWHVALGGGYGLKNGSYRRLEGPAYGITPDAYRYLASLSADVHYSPVYAKLSWGGGQVYHHDLYGLAGATLSVEQAFMPDKDMAYSPGIAVGVGARVFLEEGRALRIQLRDDFMLQTRDKTIETQGAYLQQNATLSIGYVMLQAK
jgi:outer membrane beta-barrel protein